MSAQTFVKKKINVDGAAMDVVLIQIQVACVFVDIVTIIVVVSIG